jgi:hypothetical protein
MPDRNFGPQDLSSFGVFEFDSDSSSEYFEDFAASLPTLKVIELKIKSELALDLSVVSSFTSLKQLTIIGTRFQKLDLSALDSLRFLDLDGSLVKKTIWPKNQIFEGDVIVHGPTAEEISLLSGLTTSLLVSRPPRVWPVFEPKTNLRRLLITNVDVGGTNVENVVQLSELREIGFHNIRGRITGLEAFTGLRELVSIRIAECAPRVMETDWLFNLKNPSVKIYCKTAAISWSVAERLLAQNLLA